MPQHTPDHTQPDNKQHDSGENATVLPLRTTRSSAQDTWQVERIDTEPITIQQYDLAVATLAALITQWNTHQENPNQASKKCA
ncbi:MAG: hypothetical protein ACJ72N_00770 [Labedaea sp.]